MYLTASSFYKMFTQVPKTFNGTVALQVGFLKHLRDVASACSVSLCHCVIPDRRDDDELGLERKLFCE